MAVQWEDPLTVLTDDDLPASHWNKYVYTNGLWLKKQPLWVPPMACSGTYVWPTVVTDRPAASLGDATNDGAAYFAWQQPEEHATAYRAALLCYSALAGNMYYSVTGIGNAPGAALAAHASLVAATPLALTAGNVFSISLTAALALAGMSLAALDLCSLRFNRLGSNGSDTVAGVVYVFGLMLEPSA